MEDGKELREYMTQRYASSMIFMSLLLSTELSVLFNSAGVTTQVRKNLMADNYGSLSFWAGIAIIVSSVLSILSLISIFTAWAMVSSVSEANAHCIFRSSIGQYVAELPGRFIVGSIYSFLLWLIMFFFLILPVGVTSFTLLAVVLLLFVHTITVFSVFGRLVMHTSAMGSQRIFAPEFEDTLLPRSLHSNLVQKAKANLGSQTSIMRQYRSQRTPMQKAVRPRTDSLVKFADGFNTNGDLVDPSPTGEHGLLTRWLSAENLAGDMPDEPLDPDELHDLECAVAPTESSQLLSRKR